ncbi:MAG: SulP family inorganic anion transporter [Patescibacteria group bacterium]|jgi:SulP family sulfate permease
MNLALLKERLATNWKSGLTVSLVSIPLSVSLAVASQSTPTAGIITAIWAGLLAAIFGGSHFNIVGPTGALSGILAVYALAHGFSSLSMLAIVAGCFIFLAYVLKLERFLVFVPASTMHGFTLGVAVIIACNQLNFALGLSGLASHEHFIQNVFESVKHVGVASPVAIAIFLIVLALLLLLARVMPKIPGAILVTPIGILLGYLSANGTIGIQIQTLSSKFPDISGKLFEAPQLFLDGSLFVPAITVALVAILETMISAKIADGMTRTKHDKRKEMLGLSLANIGSGIMGGIPATAALARTSLNIKSGGTHRFSAGISSVSVAIISLLLLSSFRYIPLPIIASILVFVAIRMVETEHFLRMFTLDKRSFTISLIVAGVTIYYDPIVGLLFGTAVSLIIFMERLSHGQFELIVNDQDRHVLQKVTAEDLENVVGEGETIIYSIKGQLAYINSASHIARFEQKLNGYKNIILRLRELYFVDLDGVDAFEEIVDLIHAQGKRVIITGVNPLISKMLEESPAYKKLEQEGFVFSRTGEALSMLGH